MVSTGQSVSLANSPIFIAAISKRVLDPIVATGSLLGNRHLYGRDPMSDSQHTPHKHDHVHDHGHGGSCCSGTPAPALVQLSEAPTAGSRLSTFRIEAMDGPTEQTLIQNKLG